MTNGHREDLDVTFEVTGGASEIVFFHGSHSVWYPRFLIMACYHVA